MGWIRKLVVESQDSEVCHLDLPDIPGGGEAFELAAKFCYGMSCEINPTNVAMLRCAAEYLDMSEVYGEGNLIDCTEAYMNEYVTTSLINSVKVLQTCENLLPIAEELDIVGRCIVAVASKACKEQVAASVLQADFTSSSERQDSDEGKGSNCTLRKKSRESWVEGLCVLPIDFFRRVLAAMRTRGLRYDCLGEAIVHYAQETLRGLIKKQTSREWIFQSNVKIHDLTSAMEHEQRVRIETIVTLLPPERNTASTTFLFALLRAAIYIDTTIACRLDLERRIGMQLEQASVDDLLIPAYAYDGDTLFDVDTIRRVVVNFFQQEGHDNFQDPLSMYESDSACSPPQSSMMKVARLVDCYMAEIAPDPNLKATKFISIAELMPENARMIDDGLYRAIDIYFKAHAGLSDGERKKICARMNCKKLTQEACTHAAQNDRLPVQVVVQVLYFEQVRLRSAMGGSHGDSEEKAEQPQGPQLSQRMGFNAIARPDYASVCKENRELKLEVARMRKKLAPNRDDHVAKPTVSAADKARAPSSSSSSSKSSNKFLHSFSRTLGKLNPFSRASKNSSLSSKVHVAKSTSRVRRHSIS